MSINSVQKKKIFKKKFQWSITLSGSFCINDSNQRKHLDEEEVKNAFHYGVSSAKIHLLALIIMLFLTIFQHMNMNKM